MVSRIPDHDPDESTASSTSPEEEEDDADQPLEPTLPRPTRRRRAARLTLSVLPTAFTLGNLLCGFLAIFFASRQPEPEGAALLFNWSPLAIGASFVFVGMLFDGLDGRVARLVRKTSDLGAQLDSMADMVTFGVAPAFLAVHLVRIGAPFLSDRGDSNYNRLALVVACIYAACAALRLARFNIEIASDEVEDHLTFKGLPSPGAAGTVASLILLHEHYHRTLETVAWPSIITEVGMLVIMLLSALAMVSRLRYVHMLNRYLRERAPIEYLAMAVALVLVLAIRPVESIAFGFVLYALSAPVMWLAGWMLGRRTREDIEE